MAGDIGKFFYYDDYDKAYVVSLDKTNATQMGFVPAPANTQSPPLPSRFRMRTGNFISPDGLVKRKLPAPTKNATKLKGGATIQLPVYKEGSQVTQTFSIQGRKGEKQTY